MKFRIFLVASYNNMYTQPIHMHQVIKYVGGIYFCYICVWVVCLYAYVHVCESNVHVMYTYKA